MGKRLKPARRGDPEKAIGNLKRRFVHGNPERQKHVKISPAQATGNIEVAYYRGHSAGVYDAYSTLKKHYPEAAEALRQAYGMDDEGVVRSGNK